MVPISLDREARILVSIEDATINQLTCPGKHLFASCKRLEIYAFGVLLQVWRKCSHDFCIAVNDIV